MPEQNPYESPRYENTGDASSRENLELIRDRQKDSISAIATYAPPILVAVMALLSGWRMVLTLALCLFGTIALLAFAPLYTGDDDLPQNRPD